MPGFLKKVYLGRVMLHKSHWEMEAPESTLPFLAPSLIPSVFSLMLLLLKSLSFGNCNSERLTVFFMA